MKNLPIIIPAAAVLASGPLLAQDTYVNFIRQVQLEGGVQWDMPVGQSGSQLAPLAIDPVGARFELWTVRNEPLSAHLLDYKFVSPYVPQATVIVRTEDPTGAVPRTRADRPFTLEVTTSGLLTDTPDAPLPATRVKLSHYAQAYGADGTVEDIDPSQATLDGIAYVVSNGVHTLVYDHISVPGDNLAKLRGEERFTVSSLADYQTPEASLATCSVQVWPVADASFAGIEEGQVIKFAMPSVTVQLNDLYPNSKSYVQLYQGSAQLGQSGTIVPGSAVAVNDVVPQNRTFTLNNLDASLREQGTWTMEIITETPFGVDRLAHVTFEVDRTIEFNGTLTDME